jgi:hypothetical protein
MKLRYQKQISALTYSTVEFREVEYRMKITDSCEEYIEGKDCRM